MATHHRDEADPGKSSFTLTIDEEVAVMLRRTQIQLMQEVEVLKQVGTRSARMRTHEQSFIQFRLGAIAQALEEGRLVITEPTEEQIIQRETVEIDLMFGPDAPGHE